MRPNSRSRTADAISRPVGGGVSASYQRAHEPARSVRHSPVRSVLQQAALQMNLPESDSSPGASSSLGGPEFERVRNSLRQLKMDAKEGQQLALDYDSRALVDHVNAQIRSVQRAFVVLSETVEDELGQMRGADSQQWDQLKLHATQFSESDDLKVELDRTRSELAKLHAAHSTFILSDHVNLVKRVDELETEQSELRRELAVVRKEGAEERYKVLEELTLLRRWRADIVGPFIETAGRTVQQHGNALERLIPPLQKASQELEERVSKEIPELLSLSEEARRSQQMAGEDAARTSELLESAVEAQRQGKTQVDSQIRTVRDDLRRVQDEQASRTRQLKLELESHAETLRLLAAESTKLRQVCCFISCCKVPDQVCILRL